jgi:DnaJ-class molecular chaperone
MLTAYEVFNLDSNFNLLELKRAYRNKIRLLHPDVVGDEALELFFEAEHAHRILSEPSLRQAFGSLKMFNTRLALGVRACDLQSARVLDNFQRIQKNH